MLSAGSMDIQWESVQLGQAGTVDTPLYPFSGSGSALYPNQVTSFVEVAVSVNTGTGPAKAPCTKATN